MARRMKSKIQPAVMKMNFAFTAGAAKQSKHIDLSQCASIVNRRFYRQGLNWAVAGFKLTSTANSGQISIHKLPNSWVMSNAWEKGFRHWMKEIKETLDETGTQSIEGKFLDFKIYANADHHAAGNVANLLPHSAATIGAGIQTADAGEWIQSLITIPNTTAPGSAVQYEIIAVGGNYPGVSPVSGFDSVSLINGYANSRALPNIVDPNVPADVADVAGVTPENWLGAMQNEGTTQDLGTIVESTIQDQPPYPYENDGTNVDTMYPGGQNQMNSLEIHDQEFITGTTVGGKTMLQGGNFPCGLIEVSTAGFAADSQLLLEVTLVPGTHRGYLAESMTEL